MEVCVKEDSKMVEVWLTGAERDDAALRERLKPIYQACQEKKYQVAVFLSGSDSLYPLSRDLLCYNRKQMAQLAWKREQQGIAATR